MKPIYFGALRRKRFRRRKRPNLEIRLFFAIGRAVSPEKVPEGWRAHEQSSESAMEHGGAAAAAAAAGKYQFVDGTSSGINFAGALLLSWN